MSARKIAQALTLTLATASCAPTTPERDWAIAESASLSASVDTLFAGHDTPESPGGIAALVHRGRIVHLNGYGSANREFQVPWTPDVGYRIASITKGFTAHATLLLADAGKLDLDDPVQLHLPDFPEFPAPPTIRHLITNTSGLWQDEWLLPMAGVTGHATLDEMYGLVRRQDTLNYVPGTAHNYIDTNWRTMTRVIETVTGSSWQDALRELIFAPLGMDRTLAPPDVAQVYDGQGTTYLYAGEGVTSFRFEFPFQTSGDGSLLTTFDDFLRWPRHLREGFEDGTSMFDRLRGPTRLANGTDVSYGFGLGEERHRGLRGWGHGDYLRSIGQPGALTHQFSGAPAPLLDLGDCTFRTLRSVHIPPLEVVAPDCASAPPAELHVHWSARDSPRRFVRVPADDAGTGSPHPLADYLGAYYSNQLRVHWHVEPAAATGSGTRLTLRIGAGVQTGQTFDLVPTTPDAFIAEPHRPPMLDLLSLPPLAVRFQRDAGGRVSTLHVSLDRVRGVRFTRR